MWGILSLAIALTPIARAQIPAALQLTPNLASNVERPLRYHPDGEDFVITNGGEFFNRPLYGGNTAFRVDAGDRPEFVLYLPGRGGNLRLGLRTAAGSKWLHEAETIEARYRPGEMLYVIRDPLLAGAELYVAAIALPQTEGLAVQMELHGAASVEVIAAYGGASGKRGRRDGDIGTENVPISEWFQLKPEDCAGNVFQINGAGFVLRAKSAVLRGAFPQGSKLELAHAARWASCADLLASVGTRDDPVVLVGTLDLAAGKPVCLGIQRVDATAPAELDTYREVSAAPAAEGKAAAPGLVGSGDWSRLFAEAEAHFAKLRAQVRVQTPDPWLNAAVGALNVAADAVWDEPQQAIMHGAVAWRTKLLGWRGPYALDALGWTERARANFRYWAGRQNTSPIPDRLPPADAASNLARSEAGLHSNGDLSNSHYDMNLVFIDALFRHLLWTGDTAFAKEMWPIIERHLAWERRLFRREFTSSEGKKLPLYEAYAAIWASDDLHYSGGGAAHASAYNYWHNRMAARLAPLVGAEPSPYTREADLIAEGMRKLLWVGETKMFAEYKDWLGLQLVHPSAALWTFYHIMDSGLPTEAEAHDMAFYVSFHLPWLPGPTVDSLPGGYVIGSTNWMPYTWSLNNVVFAESMHGALGLWQAGSKVNAWVAAKGSILTSMFAGICPGNVGSMTYHDVYRRESQRDFADGSGVFSRALVEGLFGVRPDMLKGELLIAPGFPWWWNKASIEHPAFSLSRSPGKGAVDRYSITSRFGRPMALRFRFWVRGVPFQEVRVNGEVVAVQPIGGERGPFEIVVPAADTWEIEVSRGTQGWDDPPMFETASEDSPLPMEEKVVSQTTETLDLETHFNDRVTEIFKKDKYLSPRSPFVSLALPAQGIGYWAGHVNATADIDDTGLRAAAASNDGKITLPNGVSFRTPGPGDAKNILFTSRWDNYPPEATLPLAGKSGRLHLLMAGSTNAMQSRLDNGEVVVTYADGTTTRLALRNPETWWPIEQDYFIDDYQFRVGEFFGGVAPVSDSLPMRVNLKTGEVRVLSPFTTFKYENHDIPTIDRAAFKGKGGLVPGGAATVLSLELDPEKELRSFTVRALANDVVIGLMAATLER